MLRVGELSVNADGTKATIKVSRENIAANKTESDIYVIELTDNSLAKITDNRDNESNIIWVDRARIAYITPDANGKGQICIHDIADGSIRQITATQNGVNSFKVSEDGSRIVFATDIENTRNETLYKDLDKTSGYYTTDLMYKHWDVWQTTTPHPFVSGINFNELIEPITSGKDVMQGEPYESPMKPFGGAESFAWVTNPATGSPALIYTSRKKTGAAYAFSTDSNLYLYDLSTEETINLTKTTGEGYDTNPVVSPDGKYLAWLSMATPKFESDQKRVMIMNLATRAIRNLTEEAGWDYSAEELSWSPDGKKLYLTAAYQGTQPIFSVTIKNPKFEIVASGMWDYTDIHALPNGKILSRRHSMSRPDEVCITDSKGRTKDITSFNTDIFAKIKVGKVEKRLIPTTDGKEMTTWVVFPPDFDPQKKYPALLYCQGGPQQAVSQFWSYRWNMQIMAANGYIVICPNRRGLPGFGTEWNKQISKDYGGKNMKDYFSAVDEISKESYVDKKHIGAIGASYGGFSVYWLAGHHNDRFAALVAHAGIFNMEAQYLETEEMWFADYDMGGAPWEKENQIAQRTFANSPHLFVNDWDTPLLVTVGELDYRILASQGMMAFNAAKMHGLDAELLVFPDENHWILKPQNAILWQRVFFNFLDKYLKPDSEQYKMRVNSRRK